MKRLLITMLVICSMLQVAWGQESSKNNTKSPFIGEWTGVYREFGYDDKFDDLRWNDFKLVVRIEQFGSRIDCRLKTTLLDGTLKYYWDPYTVTSVSNSELTILCETKESYYADDSSWNHYETIFKIIYEEGLLHLVPIEKMYFERYPSGGVRKTDCTGGIENLNIYLYKNDNW